MCSAHARAYAALGVDSFRETAVRNLDFLLKNFVQADGVTLFHTYKAGRAQYDAFLDDYAFLIEALLDVAEITFETSHILQAGRYIDFVFENFLDPTDKMFYFTSAKQKDVLMRRKDLFDSATPSGNSTMVRNLQRAGILLGREDWLQHSSGMLATLRDSIERYPSSFGQWAGCVMGEVFGHAEIAVIGDDSAKLANQVNQEFLPQKALMASNEPSTDFPLLDGKSQGNDTLVYLCQNYACQQPVDTIDSFRLLVQASKASWNG
jgi:uncharacterized protein